MLRLACVSHKICSSTGSSGKRGNWRHRAVRKWRARRDSNPRPAFRFHTPIWEHWGNRTKSSSLFRWGALLQVLSGHRAQFLRVLAKIGD